MMKKDNPSVAVMMSTYNGELYLTEQIDSILNQKNVDVHIYIRDDQSTDGTIQILNNYKQGETDRITYICGENVGPGCSFMRLLYTVPNDYDYYAFSDQDDIWLEDKLFVAIRKLQSSNKDLYMGNLMCVDKNLNEIGLRNIEPADTSPYSIMVMNKTNGCTMVFSNSFFSLLTEKNKRPSEAMLVARCHDAWTAMVGSVTNKIIYDYDYHMLYRQHENNVVGATDYNGIRRRIKQKFKKLKNKSKRNGRSRIAQEITRLFPEETSSFPYLKLYANANKFSNKIKLICSYKEYSLYGEQNFISFVSYVLLNLI